MRWLIDLIETLWNVKLIPARCEPYQPRGFNRDIVECKGIYRYIPEPSSVGFNRDIVECKAKTLNTRTISNKIFNRDIVECKVV